MRTLLIVSALSLCSLQSCRSGHFESRSTNAQESTSAMSVEIVHSNARKIMATGSRSKATHIELTFSLKTVGPKSELIRNQPLTIKLDHSSIISNAALSLKTNDLGEFELGLDLAANDEGPSPNLYEIRIQIQSQNFGAAYGLLNINTDREDAIGTWQESSKSQFEAVASFEFKVEPASQVYLRSYQSPSAVQRIYRAELQFQLFQSDRMNLSDSPVKITIASNSGLVSLNARTDRHGSLTVPFEIPYWIYGPYEPYMGVFTFEILRSNTKVSNSKLISLSMGDTVNSQILPVVAKDAIDEPISTPGAENTATLDIRLENFGASPHRIRPIDSLELEADQSIDMSLSLKVSRLSPTGEPLLKALQFVPIKINGILAHQLVNGVDSPTVIAMNQNFSTTTDGQGTIHIQGTAKYSDLKSTHWPALLILAIEPPAISRLPIVTFVKFDLSSASQPTPMSRSEFEAFLRISNESPQPIDSTSRFFETQQSLKELFAQSSTFSKERQAAVSPLQDLLAHPPLPTDLAAVRNLYQLLAKVANIPTSDVSVSFRWNEVLTVIDIEKKELHSGTLDDEFRDQLIRLGDFEPKIYSVEYTGRARPCFQMSLWRPGSSGRTEEWSHFYWCATDPKDFGPLVESYLFLKIPERMRSIRSANILIRGSTDIRDLRAKIISPRFNLNDSQFLELLDQYNQYSKNSRNGLLIRPLYPPLP